MKLLSKSIVLILILFSCHEVNAQHKLWSNNLILEGRTGYGFLINHHLEMKIYNAHYPSFEINLGKETDGRERWQTMYSYPTIGAAFWYSHMGNSDFLGSAYAVFPYVNYPLLKGEKSSFNFRLGLGLGYLTKRFTRLENYKYIAIGSHLNAAVNLSFEYRYHITNRLSVATSFTMIHFSNGSTKTPNFGVNSPSLNLALAYKLSKPNPFLNKKLLPGLYKFEFDGSKSLDYTLGFTAAYKDMGNTYGKKFMIYNGTGSVYLPVSFKSSVGVGFDLTNDGSDKYTADKNEIEYRSTLDLLRLGVTANYRLSMSKLTYHGGVGYYLYAKVRPKPSYYKFSIQYDITPNIYAGITLRTHFAEADFVGFGGGVKFDYFYLNKHRHNERKGKEVF